MMLSVFPPLWVHRVAGARLLMSCIAVVAAAVVAAVAAEASVAVEASVAAVASVAVVVVVHGSAAAAGVVSP